MPGDQRGPSQPKRGPISLDRREALDSLRPSSLPPELGELDFNWDDDLASPAPHAVRPSMSKLELDLELDEGDRPTAVPAMPMDIFVARAMAAVENDESSYISAPQVHDFDQRAPIISSHPSRDPGSFEAQPSFPPTLASSRAAVSPFACGSSNEHKAVDPLAVDFSEMDAVQPERYLTATEPPQAAAATAAMAVEQAAPAGLHDTSATLPPGEDNSRATMKDRYAMGDFTGALEIAETLLATDSADLEAQRYATSCRDVLTQMYLSRLGGLDQVIRVILPPEELRWLTLDHRAGFLLSLVDGASTVEEVLDISGMPRLDALKILATLREQRAILLGSR